MLDILKRLFGGTPPPASRPQPESRFIVRVTDAEIVCERPDGKIERVAWDELQAVIIETTEAGPIAPDVFLILAGHSSASGCVIPQGATGEGALLDRLQKLPGFDHEAFIRAMGSTDNEKFLCWKRP